MSLCACPEGPRCEAYNDTCDRRADWTCMVPLTWKCPPVRLSPKFFCNSCWERFKKAWATPMKGIDRPPGADDDWRPSIMDHIRHCQIAMAFEERKEHERLYGLAEELGPLPTFVKYYTPAQLAQYRVLRQATILWRLEAHQ